MTSIFNEGAVTRSRARQDISHRNDDTVEESKANLEEFVDYLLVLNASLESDPKPGGVPNKNYKERIKSKHKKWLKSMHGKLGNFLKRGTWEYVPRSKIPKTRKPLRCRWLFKEKHHGTKKSRLVARGNEQEPGVNYVESYSPLTTSTTVKVVLAMALCYMGYFNDWVTDMIDVEAAFLNALLDTDVFIKMPEGLRELLPSQGVNLGDVIIKLLRAQYGLVNP